MSLFNTLKKNSLKYPGKEALIIEDQKYSYKEFFSLVVNTIFIFKKNKITSNSIVLLVEDNSLSHILSLFALSYINATIVPTNTHYSFDHLKSLIKTTQPDVLISNINYCKYFRKKNFFKKIISTNKSKKFNFFFENLTKKKNLSNKKIDTEKNFLISFSSGSTAKPKPIVFSQKTKLIRFKLMKNLYKINHTDKVILACPIDHSLGMRILFLPILTGGTIVVMNKFTAKRFVNLVKKHSITFSVLVANQIYELTKSKSIFKNFYLKKGLVSASAKLPEITKNKIISKNINLYEMYGAAEIGTVASIHINKNIKNFKSVGKVYNNKIQIKILSNKNKFLKKYQIGEIVCKTSGIFKKYLNLNELTKKAFFKKYFKTGDIGYLNDKGYLYFLSRKKNIIRRNGITIYPEDIENTLLRDKNIKELAVIGHEKKIKTEIYLFVKKDIHITENYIQNICLKKLSTFHLPNQIILLENLAKSSLGKINKRQLLKYLN